VKICPTKADTPRISSVGGRPRLTTGTALHHDDHHQDLAHRAQPRPLRDSSPRAAQEQAADDDLDQADVGAPVPVGLTLCRPWVSRLKSVMQRVLVDALSLSLDLPLPRRRHPGAPPHRDSRIDTRRRNRGPRSDNRAARRRSDVGLVDCFFGSVHPRSVVRTPGRTEPPVERRRTSRPADKSGPRDSSQSRDLRTACRSQCPRDAGGGHIPARTSLRRMTAYSPIDPTRPPRDRRCRAATSRSLERRTRGTATPRHSARARDARDVQAKRAGRRRVQAYHAQPEDNLRLELLTLVRAPAARSPRDRARPCPTSRSRPLERATTRFGRSCAGSTRPGLPRAGRFIPQIGTSRA